MRKLKLLMMACALLGAGQTFAQTNYVAGWDGGNDTSSPSNFGWSSSASRTLNARNASGGIRMTTTYSGYKDETGNNYTYSSTSDPSSVIFWVRYNTSGESFTYTFTGLEPNHYYDFSGLVGWHNNSDAPTYTVVLNDGTNTLATMTKYVSTKQTLYPISSRFKTPGTITNTTNIKIVFTCNRTGDSMEAISALQLLEDFEAYRTELSKYITYATSINTTLGNSALATAILTAQGKVDDAENNVQYSDLTALQSAIAAATAGISDGDVSYLIYNHGFESSTAITANQATNTSQDYASTGWTALSTSTSNSCGAIVAYGSSYTLNGKTAPASDNEGNIGNALGISVGWGTTVAYQTVKTTLPAGRYTLSVHGFNNNDQGTNFESKFGFIPTSGSSYFSTKTSFTYNTWETDEVTFDLNNATEGVFQIGGRAPGNESTNHAKVFLDNISLTFTSASVAYDNAVSKASATYNDETYSNVTGTERTELKALIDQDASGFTVPEYFDGVTDIENAIATFTSAKQSYDEYFYENQTATRLSTDVSSVTSVTSAETAETAAHEINVLNYTNVDGGSYSDISESVFGTWTDTNVNSSQKGQHWDGTNSTTYFEQKNGYSSSDPWTMSRTQTVHLLAGSYILKVATRAKTTADATISVAISGGSTYYTMSGHHGDSGKGITTAGVASYGDGTFASTSGRGWEWKYVPFTLDSENDVTLTFSASCAGILNSYVGFCNIALLTDALTKAKTELSLAITDASAITTASINVGSGVFQIPTSAKTTLETAIETAQGVYDESTDAEEVTEATETLETAVTTYNDSELNTPADGKKYYIKVATAEHVKLNNAWVVSLGSATGNNPTGYTINASNTPASYLCQAFTFTQVSGNTYKISITRPEGEVYLTNGTKNGSAASWKAAQIQGTTDSEKAMEFSIKVSDTDGSFYIYNSENNSTIACQGGGNIYTEPGNAYFAVEEASQATVNVTIGAAVQYGTRIFPFTPSLPDGVTAYSCTASDGDVLTLVEVADPQANTPYILEATSGCETDLEGWGTASADNYTTGWLTGVYTLRDAINETYVLQNNGGKVGFYKVDTSVVTPKVGAYRCYLSVPSGARPAFFFGDETTGIGAINALTSGSATFYSVDGHQLPALQKGLNIVKTNGKTYKVMVK